MSGAMMREEKGRSNRGRMESGGGPRHIIPVRSWAVKYPARDCDVVETATYQIRDLEKGACGVDQRALEWASENSPGLTPSTRLKWRAMWL